MTELDLEPIKARRALIQPEMPLSLEIEDGCCYLSGDHYHVVDFPPGIDVLTVGKFFVNAPTDIDTLIAEVKRLREDIKQLKNTESDLRVFSEEIESEIRQLRAQVAALQHVAAPLVVALGELELADGPQPDETVIYRGGLTGNITAGEIRAAIGVGADWLDGPDPEAKP